MSEVQGSEHWDKATSFLRKQFPGCHQSEPSGCLTFDLGDEEWVLELSSNGILTCQSGYTLEDMKSLLSDGTAEDLGSDELAKQAKFYLQQTVTKYRNRLKQEGFRERTEMNDEYVAVLFERDVNLNQLGELAQIIQHFQTVFSLTS